MRLWTRRLAILSAIALLAMGAALRADESLRITPVVRDNQVLVSFELNDAYTQAVHEAIASGLRTSFSYDVELRTVVPAWIDRTIARSVVTMTDQYDNLTRRHTLTRSVDGQVQEVTVTEDESAVKIWLTRWSRLRLCDTSKLDPTRDYYVYITTRARPLGGSLLGLTKNIAGSAKFTFIP